MGTMRGILLSALVFATALHMPMYAYAETPQKKASAMFKQGNKLYARGDVKGALEKFLKARHLYPSYKLDLNIATCLYDMGRHADAARELERFLEKAEKAPPATVKAAHVRLQKLRKTLSSVKLTCPVEGAVIFIDGNEVGVTPLKRRIYLRPGLHELKLMKEGYAFSNKELELRIDEHREMLVALDKKVETPAPTPASNSTPAQKPVEQPPEPVAVVQFPADVDIKEESAGNAVPQPEEDLGGGLYVNALIGPYWASYGDHQGEITAALEVGGDVGYLWRIGHRLGLHVDASVLYNSVLYSTSSEDYQFGFLNIFVGGGLRIYFWRLWANLKVAAGPAMLLGATEDVFPLKKGELEGVPTGFALRASLGLGWTFWKGLTVTVYPAAIEYMPGIDSFKDEISSIIRYQLAVALGWQG